MTDLAFLDTETIRIDPAAESVWEIGYILTTDEPGSGITERLWQRHPGAQAMRDIANPKALDINRFHERVRAEDGQGAAIDTRTGKVLKQMPSEAVASHVCDDLHGRVIVGVNPAFDCAHITALLDTIGLLGEWDYHLENIASRIGGWLAAQGQHLAPGSKCIDAYRAIGVVGEGQEPRDSHTALGDARLVHKAWGVVQAPTLTRRLVGQN